MYNYTWTGWSGNRYENPNFKFLNPALSKLLKLKLQPDGLFYYNESDEQVTQIVHAKDSELYYVRKDVIDEIMKK